MEKGKEMNKGKLSYTFAETKIKNEIFEFYIILCELYNSSY